MILFLARFPIRLVVPQRVTPLLVLGQTALQMAAVEVVLVLVVLWTPEVRRREKLYEVCSRRVNSSRVLAEG